MSQLEQIQQKYSELSQREKLLTLITGLVAIWFVGLMMYVEPMWLATSKQKSEVNRLTAQMSELSSQRAQLEQRLKIDVNQSLKAQIIDLENALSTANNRMQDNAASLVEASEMSIVVRSILEETGKLAIRNMVVVDPLPLVADQVEQQDTENNLYQHGVKLELLGDYQSLYEFLRQVEALPWRFSWQSFKLEHESEKLVLSVEINTISLDKGFIDL